MPCYQENKKLNNNKLKSQKNNKIKVGSKQKKNYLESL